MLKFKIETRKTWLLIFTSLSSFVAAESEELSKSKPSGSHVITCPENNLISQPKSILSKEYSLIINTDLLFGRIMGQPVIAYSASREGENGEDFDFKNKTKPGFRLGLGLALQNHLSLSLYYTWMRGGSHCQNHLSAIDTNSDRGIHYLWPLNLYQGNGGLYSENAVNAYSDQKLRYQNLDLVIQTATWMMSSSLSFQPFSGFRYMYYKRDLLSRFIAIDSDETATSDGQMKIHSTGVLIGANIKYMLNKQIHFFSSLTTGILAGQQSAKGSFNETFLNTQPFSRKSRLDLSFSPLVELRFGFGWEHMFSDDMLLSLRLSYEMTSFLHNSTATVSTNTLSFLSSMETAIKTQAGVFGATLMF